MALPTLTKRLVEKKLSTYCERKVPPRVRDRIRLTFSIRHNSVTLFEQRPAFVDPSRWINSKIAQFRFDPDIGDWTLYCRDRNGRWHLYTELESSADFDVLLDEVEHDPAGIFWG